MLKELINIDFDLTILQHTNTFYIKSRMVVKMIGFWVRNTTSYLHAY